jgi:16S rRNA (cytidine1402-2'-O)-methyltransferase
VVCRELTKRFEEVTRAPLGVLAPLFAERAVRGEVVVLLDRAAEPGLDAAAVAAALKTALDRHSLKDAVALVAEQCGVARREVYQMALKLGEAE